MSLTVHNKNLFTRNILDAVATRTSTKAMIIFVGVLSFVGLTLGANLRAELHSTKLPYDMEFLSPVFDGDDNIYIIGGVTTINGSAALNKYILKFNILTGHIDSTEGTEGLWFGNSVILTNGSILYFGGTKGTPFTSPISSRKIIRLDHPDTVTDLLTPFYFASAFPRAHKVGERIIFVDDIALFYDITTGSFGFESNNQFPFSYTSTMVGDTIYIPQADYWRKDKPQREVVPLGFATYDVINKQTKFLSVPLPAGSLPVVAGSDDLGNIFMLVAKVRQVGFGDFVYRYNVHDRSLESYEVEGLPLVPKDDASAVYVPQLKRIYVFGGKWPLSNEIWFIDF